MKKLICNIVSMIIAMAILFIPFNTNFANSSIALSIIDSHRHKLTFTIVPVVFYLVTVALFVINIAKKDRFGLYKWSCLVFFIVTFGTMYLNPNSIGYLFKADWIVTYIESEWAVFLVLALLCVYVVLPFIPCIRFSHRPTKAERLQQQVDDLQKQIDELKKGE